MCGGTVGKIIDDAGEFVQENVIDPIKNDPIETIATVTAAVVGGPIAAGATKTAFALEEGKDLDDALKEGATTAAVVYGGSQLIGGEGVYGGEVEAQAGGFYGQPTPSAPPLSYDAGLGLDVMSGGTGYVTGQATTPPTVPSAFESAVDRAMSGATSDLQVGTSGYGTALRPAAEVAADLTASGFAPGTAANLAGVTAAGTGATNLLGGATALTPLAAAPNLSIQQVLRSANLANSLFNRPQPQYPNMLDFSKVPNYTGVDYSSLLNLLATRPSQIGLLGTQFQPQPINVQSLLG